MLNFQTIGRSINSKQRDVSQCRSIVKLVFIMCVLRRKMAGKELGAQGRGVSSAKNSESCVCSVHFAHSAHLLTRISFAFFQNAGLHIMQKS